MKGVNHHRIAGICILLMGLLEQLPFPMTALGQGDETASRLVRYRLGEVRTGYYEGYEVMPRGLLPPVSTPEVKRRHFVLSSRPAPITVRGRARLADSHQGIKFYRTKLCDACHVEHAQNMHSLRANITCRQCHGPEPIASIYHHFSPMNPIRRHAHVCSKCHAGAGESFATFVVHEPSPGSATARDGFASLYFAYWLMLIIFFGTLVFFIPHSFTVGLRELFGEKAKARGDSGNEHQTI